MSNRGQNVAKSIRDATIFAALAAGDSTHEQIAERLGVSRQHVSRVAVSHRDELEAEAAKTKAAAIVGPDLARKRARDAAPEAVDKIVAVMREEVDPSMAGHVLAAAKTLLDRAGVPAEAKASVTGEDDGPVVIQWRLPMNPRVPTES
jgi:hypothetical protein